MVIVGGGRAIPYGIVSLDVRSTGEIATLAYDEHTYFTPVNAHCGVYLEQDAVAVYDFNAGNGALVPDVSGYGEPLDLTITGGEPALLSPADALRAGELAHIVYTRDSSGATQIYVNGVEVAAGTSVGTLNNWNSAYPLMLGGEADRNSHGWKGTYHLAAIYDRSRTAAEIGRASFAGPERR